MDIALKLRCPLILLFHINIFSILKLIKNIIIIFSFFFYLTCNNEREVHISETIIFEGKLFHINEERPFSGIVYNLYANLQREYEGRYKDGIPNGKLIYWFKDGSIKRTGVLKEGSPIGRWTTYTENKVKKVIDY